MRELLEETIRGRKVFEQDTAWENDLGASLSDVDGESLSPRGQKYLSYQLMHFVVAEVVHEILDMYIVILTALTVGGDASSTPLASPHSPSDPTTNMSSASNAVQTQNRYLVPCFSLPTYWTSSTLTQLKIQLHQSRAEGIGGRPKIDLHTPIDTTFGSGLSDEAGQGGKKDAWLSLIEGLGKNEGTVRFVFG